ncbi:MAG: radical SAM protein [Clostridia bacterium]|nr:radical SAM protein [Clostridia bacterium]
MTQKCNALCDQCGSRCDAESPELLSKEQILSALRDIKEHIGVYTMLNVTGGEPLMRADLFEMMSEASAMGFEWGMVTNGSLITPERVEKMRGAGMKTVTVSIDGLKDTHDSLRHLPGCWDRIIAGLKMLRSAAFLDHLQVTFTANRRNVREFEELYRVLAPIGLDSIRVSVMDPIGRALDNRELLLTREEIVYFTGLVNTLNRRKKGTQIIWGCPHYLPDLLPGRKFFCFSGIYTASILANGDIFVCPNVERRPEFIQGSILKDSFSEVWSKGFERFRKRELPGKCRDCSHRDSCSGDSLHTMDFDAGEPIFCWRDLIEKPDPETFRSGFFKRNADVSFCEVSGDEPGEGAVIIEPEAYRDIERYFHLGKAQPQSMYEQQMALIGFTCGGDAYVRYVIPCDGALRADDNAIFSPKITATVKRELAVINKNYWNSSDAALPGSQLDYSAPMRFLGFIHSHPTQPELRYSTGDDRIHLRMLKENGFYVGILVHPETNAMGAYGGKELKQIKLIIPD